MLKGFDTAQNWLLLLPEPPSDVSTSSLRIAYGPGLSASLTKLSEESLKYQKTAILDIAVACDDDVLSNFSSLQGLLASLYRLICLLCLEQKIDLEYGNDVDFRISIFRAPNQKPALLSNREPVENPSTSYFPELSSFAECKKSWSRILSLDGENGESILQLFSNSRFHEDTSCEPETSIERLPGGLTLRHPDHAHRTPRPYKAFRHHIVAVGGTFDHLHPGHKLLLSVTALLLELNPIDKSCLIIGITGDELLKNKKFRNELQDFAERQINIQNFVLNFLQLFHPNFELGQVISVNNSTGREVHNKLKSGLLIKYIEIFDPFGPTITDESITALVVSGETRQGGKLVNEKRREKNWAALEIFEVDVLGTDTGELEHKNDEFEAKISSTDIRRRLQQKRL